MRLALSNLLVDKMRLALTAVAVAFSVMLILFLVGFRTGVFLRSEAYLRHIPGSVVVMPEGLQSTAGGSGSSIAPETVVTIRGEDGVAQAVPVLLASLAPEFHGRKEAVTVIGYDPALGGGPWNLAAGREPRARSEIVMDEVLASRHGFRIGNTLELGGHSLTVVGLSSETSSWVGAKLFTVKETVEELLLAPGRASMLFVVPAEGASADELAQRLSGIPTVDAHLKTHVIANDRRILARILDQPLLLMVGTAFVVGAVVVGIMTYSSTQERRHEYGVLKAIGARNSVLYRLVLSQALTAASAGALLGVVFAFAMAQGVMEWRPQYLVSIGPLQIAVTVTAGLLMAIAGALLPAFTIARVAPADVFRR